jgi:hypothetical protein
MNVRILLEQHLAEIGLTIIRQKSTSERAMRLLFTGCTLLVRAVLGVLVCGVFYWTNVLGADNPAPPTVDTLASIVVTAKRLTQPVPDIEVKARVESAMASDQFFNDEHVTVTIKDGVVTLHGIVFDEWDLRAARRIARRIVGVKRVINDLEIQLGGE